ncbi:unnamed protein product [Trichobilharzia szidati]|nr:unnamed protein product [Trichobilharzia szidati]
MKKFTVSAPAKAILFGEHAVVYGYPAIATTIGLHCYFTVTIEDEICENVVVDFKDLSEKSIYIPIKIFHSNLCTLSVSERAWMLASEILGCSYDSSENTPLATCTCVLLYLFIRALQLRDHECDYSVPTFFNGRHFIRITVQSDIPRGSGIGSSGAFSVAATTAILLLTGYFPLEQVWSADKTQCELISSLSRDAECIIHGLSSGLDTTICTYGGPIVYWKDRIPSFRRIDIPNTSDIRLLLVNTNIIRRTSVAVKKVSDLWKEDKSHVNSIFKEIGTIVEDISSILEKSLSRELKQSFSDHVTRNQFLLNELGVSNSVVNQIIEEMKQIGIPAKITGAGLGGFVLGFILESYHDEKLCSLIRNWNERSLWAKIVSIKATGIEYNAHSL